MLDDVAIVMISHCVVVAVVVVVEVSHAVFHFVVVAHRFLLFLLLTNVAAVVQHQLLRWQQLLHPRHHPQPDRSQNKHVNDLASEHNLVHWSVVARAIDCRI